MRLGGTVRRPSARVLSAAAILSLVLGACGGSSSSGRIAPPTGDARVLSIESGGGLIGPAAQLTSVPGFVLLGDGRVIVPGAVEAIYPGPAMNPLTVRRLTDDGIQAVLQAVAATHLFGQSRDYRGASQVVMDASTTVFTLHADGREVRVSFYALGALDEASVRSVLDPGEADAYRSLQELSGHLSYPDGWLGAAAWADPGWQTYQPTALRLLVRNADGDAPDATGIRNQLVAWPDATDPATFGAPTAGAAGQRCGVVDGDAAATWLRSLAAANQLTRFVAAGHRYQVVPRQLLPYEARTCPASA